MSVFTLLLSGCGKTDVEHTITLNKNTLDLTVGETEVLSVAISPNDITSPELVWNIDSPIATIDNGSVTALAEGVADIKVFLDLNNNTFYDEDEPFDTCILTVSEQNVDPVAVTSVTLSETSLILEINEEKTLITTVLPENATQQSITWESSNSAVVAVNNGKVVALSAGSATIMAYVDENLNAQRDNEEKFATCVVSVKGITPDLPVLVSSVSISPTTLSLEEGSSATVSATVLPSNSTYKTLTWLSSDNLVATVSGGKVNGVKPGVATITAYVDENTNASLDKDEKRATLTVSVTAKSIDPQPSEDPIPAQGENLPIGNKSLSGPNNTMPVDITNWVNYDFFSSLPEHWSFIMGNNKKDTSSDFYAESAGGGFKFSRVYYGLQSPLLNSWLKTEVRLTVSQVFNNSQSANEHKNKPIFHIYSYDSDGYYLGMQTYEQQSSFANTKEIKFYIANPDMAYFEIRLNAHPCKSSQCYNFGVSQISIKGWDYGL